MLSFLKKIPLIFIAMKLFAFGDFFDPTTTAADDGTPNLSVSGEDAFDSKITTNGSGKYVYALWSRDDGANDRIQITISSDNGITFSNPITTPADDGTPNLSDSGKNARRPDVITDDSGKYVYAVWEREDSLASRIQVVRSSDYGVNFSLPVTTPAGTPNLSESGKNAFDSKITTDSTGRYVYAIWQIHDGARWRAQVAISSDYGVTFTDPTTTPGGTPNLSVGGESAFEPQITTDSTGEHVYAVWYRMDASANWRVQVARSSDFGVTFSDPITTPADDGTPNLSNSGESAKDPQIATSGSGIFVYAIWYRADDVDGKYRVQVAKSSDYGVTFSYPIITPADDGTPNLSNSGGDAEYRPQIITNYTGQYVYAVWARDDGTNYRIQVARSSDYGVTFSNPTTTPAGTPDLSIGVGDAYFPKVTTDNTGKYVYVTWFIDDGANRRVQAATSSDYGVTFSNPTTTPADDGTPNLSDSGGYAELPQITADNTGQYVYVSWYREDEETNLRIQAAITGLNPSFNKYLKKFLLQNDRVVELFWNEFLEAKSYRVYFNSLNNLIYDGVENRFFHHGTNVKDIKTYYITWIDVNNVESPIAEIVVR